MTNDYIKSAQKAIDLEVEGLNALKAALDDGFVAAVECVSGIKGRLIVSGMGKSGHIARKIAATLASTGTPAFFIHPGEASHGDLGMITEDDAVLLLSNSGETSELTDIINYTKRFSIPLIGIARRSTSTLVEAADIAIVLPEIPEASPVNAPTTSTTMMLAWGDALAVALLESRGFGKEDFQVFHPGGKLGSQFKKVSDLMHAGDSLPTVAQDTSMSEVLITMTKKSLGCAIVTEGGSVLGIITDGDLRRHMESDLVSLKAGEVMKPGPISVSPEMVATEALGIMNDKSITSLLVCKDDALVGILHIHDLLRAGVS